MNIKETMARAMAESVGSKSSLAYAGYAKAALSALKEAGYVGVKREPTRGPMNAMYRAAFCEGDILPDWEKIYRAMIAAQEEDDE